MSALAKKLAAAPAAPAPPKRHGPANLCRLIYKPDPEDAKAIEEFRNRRNQSWATAHAMYDELAGVTTKITNDKFRYHWNFRCGCWPDDLRKS